TGHHAFRETEGKNADRIKKLLSIKGKKTPTEFHRQLGRMMWSNCGMSRSEENLKKALAKIPEIRDEFWQNITIPGSGNEFNQTLEKAGRVADFLEFAELMVKDTLERKESCGGHFREEMQTSEGEAKRNDAEYSHASVWEYSGEGKEPLLNREPLTFETVHIAVRSYK
ncbi:MAG: fumarate reductase/succinate dehydrogenase flavoprotein subunit, partial [bacterium]